MCASLLWHMFGSGFNAIIGKGENGGTGWLMSGVKRVKSVSLHRQGSPCRQIELSSQHFFFLPLACIVFL